MPSITNSSYSNVPGGFRETTYRSDGTSTDVTITKSGTTIDDHDRDGNTRSYIGVTGPTGTASSATRLREIK